MKRLTSLMLMLLCAVTTWAGPTDLPELTTDEANPVWYTIKNTRSSMFATYAGDATAMVQRQSAVSASLFYFTAADVEAVEGYTAVKIHNSGTSNILADFVSWTAEGAVWYLSVDAQNETPAGLHITNTTSNEVWNAWNDKASSSITSYYAKDAGSVFEITKITDYEALFDIPAVKAAAIAEVELLATATNIYPAATETVTAINAVTPAGTSIAELDAAVKEINALVATYKTNAYKALDGKNFSLYTPGRSQYVKMSALSTSASATVDSPEFIWRIVENNGAVNLYNPVIGKYLGKAELGSVLPLTEKQDEADAYNIIVASNPANPNAKISFVTADGNYVHLNGRILYWYAGDASEWAVEEISDEKIAEFTPDYKNTKLATLDAWAKFPMVFDVALINEAKAAINAVTSTGFEAFDAYDAELEKVTDAVAAREFAFQTTATDANRNGVWLSASTEIKELTNDGYKKESKAGFGICVNEKGENTRWTLHFVNASSFYLYNELAGLYLGAPGEYCPLSAVPVAAYSFEVVDEENGIVEMKSNGGTLHAANHDNMLINYDYDDQASRWYFNICSTPADEIQAVLDGITEADYAEVPALGQYKKAGYDALVAAKESAQTIKDAKDAIAAFNKAKNVPVYFITSAHTGYAAGSAIYYDGEWKWDTANKYNKQMWMKIQNYAQENVPTVNAYDANGTSYEICDYLTGTVMRGKSVQIVAIEGLENAYNLQYNADAESIDAAQHAKDTKQLVNWKPATATDALASAWHVEYLGTSYALEQIADEKIAALAALQEAYDAKLFYEDVEIGEGLGQYTGNKDAVVAALDAAEVIFAKPLLEQFGMDVNEINAAATALNEVAVPQINLPVQGKYYRIKGACDATPAGYYITGNTNADGGRIACKKDADDSTIFFYSEGKLQAYESKAYIGLSSEHLLFADDEHPASTIEFAGSPRKAGTYTIKSADRYIYYKTYNGEAELDRYSENNSLNLDWILEEVEINDTELAIDEVNVEVENEVKEIYDLQGRRIYEITKPGIYVVNGNKVLVK